VKRGLHYAVSSIHISARLCEEGEGFGGNRDGKVYHAQFITRCDVVGQGCCGWRCVEQFQKALPNLLAFLLLGDTLSDFLVFFLAGFADWRPRASNH
jgi:hypothetical protein